MLTTLRIKNLALVSDLTVEFRPGFNALTGETYTWSGRNYVRLGPGKAHVLEVRGT